MLKACLHGVGYALSILLLVLVCAHVASSCNRISHLEKFDPQCLNMIVDTFKFHTFFTLGNFNTKLSSLNFEPLSLRLTVVVCSNKSFISPFRWATHCI